MEEPKTNVDPFKDAPVFKQMMQDMEREQNEFFRRFEKIVPIVRAGQKSADTVIVDGKEHKLPWGSLPVIYPVTFDQNLSVIFGIDEDTHYEWLQNKHVEIAKDKISTHDLLNRAYQNLFQQIQGKMSISMISDNIGMLTNCNALESSLILVSGFWETMREKLKADDLVFGIPAQDVLVFTRAIT